MESRTIKILAIDDNRDNLISIKALIQDIMPDAVTLTTESGAKGIELAIAENPDVILLDIIMPVMDGYEICLKLKADKKLSDIPVVFVTALKDDKESRIRALEVGADAFLAKPIDESELKAQISAMVKIKTANLKKHAEKEQLAVLVAEQTIELKSAYIATLNLLEDLRKENEARKKSEEALFESNQFNMSLLQTIPFDIDIVDGEGNILYQSDKFKQQLIEIETCEKCWDYYCDDKKQCTNCPLFTGIKIGETKSIERFGILGGKIYEVIHTGMIFKGQKALMKIFMDITARKQAEEKLKKVTAAVENSKVSVVITDKNGIIEYANPFFAQLTGYTPDEYIGENPRFLKSGFHTTAFYAEFWETIKSGKTWEGEFYNLKKDGTYYWENAIVSSIQDDANVITHFVAIKTDITAAKQMIEDLKIAKEKAEENERLKSAFLANMSHEIRTPMNGILGFAGLLKEPKLTGDEQQEFIGIIEKSGARMLNIINDVIAISKVESGQMKTFISPTNVNEQIEYIYNFFKPEAEQKGIHFVFKNSLTDKEAIVKTDKEKLYAVLTNLVKNAIKFSDSGTIEIGYKLRDKACLVSTPAEQGRTSLVSAPSELEFYVKDNGVGIPKDRMEAIFDRFVQADISDKRAFQGAGLGLSISKAYVEMLGGRIWVESEEGKGSGFYFTIPCNNEPEDENTVVEEFVVDSADIKFNKENKEFKILIAEDDEISGMLISMAIKAFGKNVLKTSTGIETVEVCRNNPDLDVVLMDIKMPEMDGYEATRQIRQFNNDVIIIAQTAYALPGDREKALEAGCNDYIAKPFGQSSLTALMKKYLRQEKVEGDLAR